ncbi:MAG: oxidoreductase [Rhodospirillales bacterium]
MASKPKLAVWKFSSCDGCQLSLLDLEDELLAIADSVEIAYFLEATRAEVKGPYDVSLVEGSVTTPEDLKRIQKVRRQSRYLVTIGACATSGGIQALKNGRDVKGFIDAVYANPAFIDTLDTSTPIAAHVDVDFELRGCPIDRHQLLTLLIDLVQGRGPRVQRNTACFECKLAGTVCVMVAKGEPCMGPVTQEGCGNLCPGFARGCYGCFGPAAQSNPAALADHWLAEGVEAKWVAHRFAGFNAAAPAFAKQINRLTGESLGPEDDK